jgi:hypothetical protein
MQAPDPFGRFPWFRVQSGLGPFQRGVSKLRGRTTVSGRSGGRRNAWVKRRLHVGQGREEGQADLRPWTRSPRARRSWRTVGEGLGDCFFMDRKGKPSVGGKTARALAHHPLLASAIDRRNAWVERRLHVGQARDQAEVSGAVSRSCWASDGNLRALTRVLRLVG